PPDHVRNLAEGNPDPALLPPLGPALRRLDPPPRLYGEDLVLPELLDLERRLFRADGVPSEHVTIVSGALDGIERALLAHLRPGDRVAVEDPAFVAVRALLAALGLVEVPVPIDDSGLRPDALADVLADGVSALIVTPRAQNPTGAALDARRVRELRRVLAAAPDLLVIEDDHAGPVAGVPAATLCRGREHWSVVRSHSKALGPDTRVAALSGDAETIARIEGRQLIGMRWVSHVLQRLVVELWSQRGTRARLARAEAAYTRRRGALIDALAGRGIAAHGRSGLNVWIPVREESVMVAGLLERGWAVAAGERFRIASPPAIRVTTVGLDPHGARDLANDVADLLRPAARTYPV
ncbi:MAG: aminotransferase class I/II-fold pyridoxal phosphate-dependent enzyme, partial [Deltaproteobacteria bacterium]|nr:aminotransferase class I/II-fold pyridoxal phosphate-dependent enzyme [Deltaproteobacteria bacterium]